MARSVRVRPAPDQAHFERIRDKMKDAASLVFRDLDFMGLFLELTLFHRMDVLAEKLVPWESSLYSQFVGIITC